MILVHAGTYMYRHQPDSALRLIMLCPPSCAYESRQNVWLGPFAQFPSAWQSPPQSDHPGVACHCQSFTAKCSPHTRCCNACHPSGIVASGTKSGFFTYRYVPVCTKCIRVRMLTMVRTGMYSVCTGIMTCMIAMKSGTVLVFKHHHVPVPYTQYLFALSKVKT